MPFKSTAQQRFMYANHPDIAHRWSDEMKHSRRRGAKEHPIKSAHLPRHVDKGDSNVGKRMTGGSFTRGGSTIVAHGSTKVERRSKLQRYGGNGVKHGSRLPAVEHFSKLELPSGIRTFGHDVGLGMHMGRDLRPANLVPTSGKLTPGARTGRLIGAATATPGRTAATIGGTAVTGGTLASLSQRQNVNKGPVWTPTAVAMNAQPLGPVKPLSTAPVSTAAGGQVKQGALVPNGKPAQGNVAGRAAGGQKSGSIRANGTMGAAATMGSVGSVASAQPTSKVTKARQNDQDVSRATLRAANTGMAGGALIAGMYKNGVSGRRVAAGALAGGAINGLALNRLAVAGNRRAAAQREAGVTKSDPPGTLRVRSHGPTHRRYDPESRRQRRLGQAQAATALGGSLAAGHGVHHTIELNRNAKVAARTGASTGVKHTAAVSRRGAALVGAGALGLAASNKIRRYANDPHNREWS